MRTKSQHAFASLDLRWARLRRMIFPLFTGIMFALVPIAGACGHANEALAALCGYVIGLTVTLVSTYEED